ncbi:PEP-CTERM sorting domain-containing protein [Oleiharenicola lentus]|uniref:PEP-CTERM sorting domain-containing protein n=1 Tax=Oleiharenicola lentus TaxID=2508720 RepID=UPI003F67C477
MHIQTRSRFRSWLLITAAFAVAFPTIAAAQIVFTLRGTINTDADPTALGYSVGHAVTISFTLNDFAPTPPRGDGGSIFSWGESNTAHPQLFSSVGGTGINGTFARAADPLGEITVENFADSSRLFLNVGANNPEGMGLSVNGYDLERITISASFAGLVWDTSAGTLPDPTFFFQNYVGTYAQVSTDNARIVDFNNFSPVNEATITIDTLTISYTPLSAVPEPSTYAAIAGMCALGFATWRRHRSVNCG